ncbi:mariner Mos1 transposase [Trichonephila clavipes]|nr:mariner Mos1 transposase [Trichonephila clavipes]
MMAKRFAQEHLAEQLNVDQSTVSRRLKAIGKIIKVRRWVPHELTDRQQENRKIVCEMLLARYKRKRQHKVISLDDNAPNHRAKPTKNIVKVLGWMPLEQASYSPHLVLSDYHLFASLGHVLADQRFTSYENVKSWRDDWLASKD